MAVIQVKEGNGLLNTLGALATVASGFAGAPAWLGSLGAGLGMLGGGSAGGGASGLSGANTIKDILDQITGMWKNPASGSIAKTANKVSNTANTVLNNAQTNDNWQKALILQNQNPFSWRRNSWQ